MINPKAYFPVLVTNDIAESKEFFTKLFGFEPVFDADWYVHLVHESGAQLGFLVPNHPSQPPAVQKPFQGGGLIYSFEVENVDEAYEKMKDSAEILLEPKTEEWGQRHFLVSAPSGLIVDVIKNEDPSLDAT